MNLRLAKLLACICVKNDAWTKSQPKTGDFARHDNAGALRRQQELKPAFDEGLFPETPTGAETLGFIPRPSATLPRQSAFPWAR
jgi:hypothetical protein